MLFEVRGSTGHFFVSTLIRHKATKIAMKCLGLAYFTKSQISVKLTGLLAIRNPNSYHDCFAPLTIKLPEFFLDCYTRENGSQSSCSYSGSTDLQI